MVTISSSMALAGGAFGFASGFRFGIIWAIVFTFIGGLAGMGGGWILDVLSSLVGNWIKDRDKPTPLEYAVGSLCFVAVPSLLLLLVKFVGKHLPFFLGLKA